MKTLAEFKKELLADGKIDADEVKEIEKAIYADDVIDKEEADFMFELNDAVSNANNDKGWATLFVRAISDFLLKDETSPDEIDENEAAWLYKKIGNDGKVDGTEKELLINLKKKAKSFPSILDELLK